METGHPELIARELHLAKPQVAAVAALLAEGATIPFIARSRKEATGSLDEVAVGAFVDIGVHQGGLVHISELSDRRVRDPLDIVKVRQKVQVTVLAVDPERNRIALSMKTVPRAAQRSTNSLKPGRTDRQPPAPPPRSKHQPFNNPFAELLKKR